MKCPECGKILRPHINKHQDEDNDFVDVEFYCDDEECLHVYFARVKEDDLLEA